MNDYSKITGDFQQRVGQDDESAVIEIERKLTGIHSISTIVLLSLLPIVNNCVKELTFS